MKIDVYEKIAAAYVNKDVGYMARKRLKKSMDMAKI